MQLQEGVVVVGPMQSFAARLLIILRSVTKKLRKQTQRRRHVFCFCRLAFTGNNIDILTPKQYIYNLK